MSIVLMSDPKVAAIPVADNGERLTDIRAGGHFLVDDRRCDAAGTFALLRSGVVDRLLHAQKLLPDGLRLRLDHRTDPFPTIPQPFHALCVTAS